MIQGCRACSLYTLSLSACKRPIVGATVLEVNELQVPRRGIFKDICCEQVVVAEHYFPIRVHLSAKLLGACACVSLRVRMREFARSSVLRVCKIRKPCIVFGFECQCWLRIASPPKSAQYQLEHSRNLYVTLDVC